MTAEVESIVRSAVRMDPGITGRMLELALSVLRGEPIAPAPPAGADLPPIISYGDARRLLRIKRSAFFEMIRRGILKRVFGSGEHGIGVTRESFLRVYEGKYGRGRR